MAATKLISYENLELYHSLITSYIDAADAQSIKRITYNSTTRVVSFYKTATAPEQGEDTPYTTITLPDTSNFINKIANATAGDFVTVTATGELVDAGATIAAEKITIVDAGSLITATNVEGALQELASASAGGVASKTIWLNPNESVTSGYLKTYGIYQGANSYDAQSDPATLIGKIDIPRDLVVTAGKVVTVEDGVDSDGESTAVADGTYVKLTIANQTEKIYINVADLCDVYTAQQNATQVQLAISASNVISATIVAGSVTATELASNAVTTAKITDENVTKAKLAQGIQDSLDLADSAIQTEDMVASNVVYEAGTGGVDDVTVADAIDDLYDQIGAGGSVAQQIEDAINDLDSSTTDQGVTGTSGSVMNAMTSLDITDGKISAFGYTTLGSAALQADTYFLKSADYSISSDQDIRDIFTPGE